MKADFKIDTSKFNAMCHQMAELTGGNYRNAVEYEVAKVMETAVRLTPAANVGRIRDQHDRAQFTAQPETLYQPQTPAGMAARGRARRVSGGKLLYDLNNHYPDLLWSAIVQARGESLKRAIAARGLSKRTWLEIARALGFEISAAGFVRRALPSNPAIGLPQLLGVLRVKRLTSNSQIAIRIENAMPTINAIGGQGILQRAINGRVRYFKRNLRLKVFDAVATIAKRYPGVAVTSA